MNAERLRGKIFSISTGSEFEETALEVFRYQYSGNPLYRKWCNFLGILPENVDALATIPFLPVRFFRNHMVVTGEGGGSGSGITFTSSGTEGMSRSEHYVKDISLYEESFTKAFTLFYSKPGEVIILALLPSYLEREGSSLVYMADRLIGMSDGNWGGFYLDDYDKLLRDIEHFRKLDSKIILLGVSFALLKLAREHSPDLSGIIVMETGGMKGRDREITREELHDILSKSFNTETIHSEYGMTELLSQAYSAGRGIFRSPPWMRIMIRDMYDPLSFVKPGVTGGINIIDLANLYSCSFIATSDLGKCHPDLSFEVTGRFDNSDIRGCNLLVQ